MKKIIGLLFVLIIIFSSCSRNKMGVPADLSTIENVVANGEWVVIVTPYAAFKNEPNKNASSSSHGRRGDVLFVLGKSLQKEENHTVVWYKLEQGWISESDLLIYSNKLQAEYASSQF